MILRQRIARTRDRDLWLWCIDHLEGPIPHPDFDDNGCTCAPDYMLVTGEAIWPACRTHDWHYSGQHNEPTLTRAEADRRFRINIYRVLRHQGANRIRAAYYALIYWRAVVRLGARHFTPYTPPEPPDEPYILPRAA